MFGFDGSTKAIIHFLQEIKNNKEAEKLNHQEVRAYARLILVLLPSLQVDDRTDRIKTLLAAISSAGLPHYDRSFAAEQIIKLLEKQEEDRVNSSGGEF